MGGGRGRRREAVGGGGHGRGRGPWVEEGGRGRWREVVGGDKLKGGTVQQKAKLGSLKEMSTGQKEEDRPWENTA